MRHQETTLAADRRDLLKGALVLPALGWPAVAPAAEGAVDPLMQPGISLALAKRRAAQITNIRYDIGLDVTAADRAVGAIEIRFDRRTDDDLILDFRGTVLAELMANGTPIAASARSDGHLVLPARALKRGANIVTARFETPIAASGAAIIRFRDSADGRTYLYTLLVPSDANLLFPCFDQPDLKARIRWQVIAPTGWTVIANGPVEA